MGVNINIKKNEHIFIDGATGEQFTPAQFAQRHSGLNVGRHEPVLPGFGSSEEEAEETARREAIRIEELKS